MSKFEELKPRLISLGFGFYGTPSREPADPEQTILDVLSISISEPKTLKMLLVWLEHNGELVHVERIRALAGELPDFELRLLGAVALKQVKTGDRRFSMVADWVRRSVGKGRAAKRYELESSDPYLISKQGRDEELDVFGVDAAAVEPANAKKLLPTHAILKRNAWLRLRALIGANFRADLAYLMAHNRSTNAYQAAKIAGCSVETAYRLWKGLKHYPRIERLAG